MHSKHLIVVVTSFLLFAFIYSSSSTFDIFAVPADKKWGTYSSACTTDSKTGQKTCCWREPVPGQILGKTYCQTCDSKGKVCKEKVLQFSGSQIYQNLKVIYWKKQVHPLTNHNFPQKADF